MADIVAQSHGDNRLLAAMSPETLALMGSDLRQISLTQGAVIYEPGDPLDEIYFPQTGMISLLVVTKDGGSIETATVGREGAVGLHRGLGARRSFTRANTQIAGRFSVIRAAQFAPIVREDRRAARPDRALHRSAVGGGAADRGLQRRARRLLAALPLAVAEHRPHRQRQGDFDPGILAQMLGVRRTTVTLLAQSIQKKGLIKYSRGHITILDRPGLEACACECYDVIRHDKLPLKWA